jgi:hypothetical protein
MWPTLALCYPAARVTVVNMSDDADNGQPRRRLPEHPAMKWRVVGKVVESIEIGWPDEAIIVFEDGSRLEIKVTPAGARYQELEDVLSGLSLPSAP